MSNEQTNATEQSIENQQTTESTNSETQEQNDTDEVEEYKEPIIKSYTPTKQSDGTFNTEVDLNDLIEGGVNKNNLIVLFRYKSNKGTYSDWSNEHRITINREGHFGLREGIFKDIRLSNKYKGFVVTNKITILPLTAENFMDMIPENHNIHSVDYELWLNTKFNDESNRVSTYKLSQYFGFYLLAPSFGVSRTIEDGTTVYLRLRINYTHKDKPTEVINGEFWATDCKYFNITYHTIYTTVSGLMLNKEHPYTISQNIYVTGNCNYNARDQARLFFSLNRDGSDPVNGNEWYKQFYNYTGIKLYLYNGSFTATQSGYNGMVKNAKEFEYTSWGEPLPIFYMKLKTPQGHGLNIPEGYYAQFNEWVKVSPGGILHEIKDLPESINKGEPLTFKVNITHSFIKELDKLSSYTTNNGYYYWFRTSYQYNTGSGGIYISGNPDNLTSKALIDNINPSSRNYASPILNNTTLNKPVYKEYDVTIQPNAYNSFIGSDGYLYLTGYFNNGGFTKGVGKIHKVRIISQDT